MKWGRRKSSSSSSSSSVSRPSLISSWLSKLKKMGANDPEPEPARDKPNVNVKGKGRSSWSSMSSSVKGGGVRGGRHFFGGEVREDEAFWRLSFGEDGKKGRGVLRSVLYDSDDELEGPPSSFRSSRSNAARFSGKDESQKFRDLVFSIKVKELPEEMGKLKREKEMEIKTPRKGSVKELKFRSMHRRALEERLSKLERDLEEAEETQSTKTVQKDVLEVEPAKPVLTAEGGKWESPGSDSRKHCYGSPMKPRDSNLKTIEEDRVPAADNFHENGEDSAQKFSPQWQKMKERKIEELKIKTEKHRKSYYISRELQGRTKQCNKVRVYSPRTPTKVEICKIKALEDLKRGRLKIKKRAKETTALESLAVVKCSFDPEKDFRDSMMEMILEERISKPEELEELLACYLTLNDDKYHDLIIKVFRQVWLDLNGTCFHTEMHDEDC